MGNLIDLTGRRFGRFVVVERDGSDRFKRAMWKCRCDCGEVRVVHGFNLTNGNSKSCGCLKVQKTILRSTSHGKRGSRLYRVWQNMKKRCSNPKVHNYHRYGGRGITVCDEWSNDFGKFYEWAMANGYDENAPYMQCTIDRIDNDKGYSPDNCRWADAKTQVHNRSVSRKENRNERYQAN